MAEVIDFSKYVETKEVDSYATQEQALCLTCPECDTQDFTVFLDGTLQCVGCDLGIAVEWE